MPAARFRTARFGFAGGGWFAGVVKVVADHGDGTYTVQPSGSDRKYYVVADELGGPRRPGEWAAPPPRAKRTYYKKKMVPGLIGVA